MIVITSESNENNLYENHINNSDPMSFLHIIIILQFTVQNMTPSFIPPY